MAALLCLAWCIGGAIRFNIAHVSEREKTDGEPKKSSSETPAKRSLDHHLHRSHSDSIVSYIWQRSKDLLEGQEDISYPVINALEKFSQLVLAFAYVISVTYYIQLLGNFLLNAVGFKSQFALTVVSVGILGGIAMTGYLCGLKLIERVEKYAINLNLSVIVALIASLAFYNASLWLGGKWSLPSLNLEVGKWEAFRSCLGLLVIVQGFETSRFLGAEHSAKLRVRTMRWAQGIASVIYITFLIFMLVVVTPQAASKDVNVTAIIGLVGIVASVLPVIVTVAALGSQFSAAVADEAGCGGLLSQLLGKHLNDRTAYLLIGGTTMTLAFSVDVLQIVSFASRAFATFYCVQCAIAALYAWQSSEHSKTRAICYGILSCLALTITLLAKPVEG
jgi:hypothetical protein